MKKAFTLVEMLVALVLISLLIGVAVFAFRLQLISIHKTKTEGLNRVIKYTQIRSLIESMKYYVVQEYDMLNMPMQKLHYFFNGDEKKIIFITTNPIFSDTDALVELTCKEDTLTYKEEPLFFRIDYLRPLFLNDSKSVTLYKYVKKCTFQYKDLEGLKQHSLQNKMPKSVLLRLETNLEKEIIYVNIKADNNKTKAKVDDAMFPAD